MEGDAKSFLLELEKEDMLGERPKPRVLHLYYEFGFLTCDKENLIKENSLLAVSLEYEESSFHHLPPVAGKPLELRPLQYPRFKDYKAAFAKGRERLLDGDCYQFNLTCPFFFGLDQETDPKEFLAKAWSRKENIGGYGHCTFLGSLNKLLFSNSPECLFQITGKEKPHLVSMPIKGTVKAGPKGLGSAWKKLKNSTKDQAELYMIADLVRNDLTGVQMNPSVIRAKKLPLRVPGIVHQYSLIEAEASPPLNLRQCAQALFPGGSVTGAPKKRVLEILDELETYQRGFYCGSTIVLHKSLKAASINIRSCEVDFSSGELKYCAGGGITLNSKVKEEFEEAYAKVESFLQILKD